MTALRHLAVRCTDLDVSARFWIDVFGFEEVGRIGDGDSAVGVVYLSDGVLNVSLVRMAGDVQGLDHIGFVVDDPIAAAAIAERAGAVHQFTPEQRTGAKAAGASFEIKMSGPDGIRFDLSSAGWPMTAPAQPGSATTAEPAREGENG